MAKFQISQVQLHRNKKEIHFMDLYCGKKPKTQWTLISFIEQFERFEHGTRLKRSSEIEPSLTKLVRV